MSWSGWSRMYRCGAMLLALGLPLAVDAAIITQWDFEGDTLTPNIGTGTASNVGGTSSAFAAGVGGNPNRGWNTSAYPAQGTGSGTAGVQFMTSTVGWNSIVISYDHRASGTASRWAQFEYTIDGGANWIVFGNNGGGLSPHDTFYSFSFDLSSITAVNNNPDFGFRILSIFSPVAFDTNDTIAANREIFGANEAYHRARVDGGTGGVYGSAGTWRFDNVTITGVPEPSSMILSSLGLCGMAGMGWYRRRKQQQEEAGKQPQPEAPTTPQPQTAA